MDATNEGLLIRLVESIKYELEKSREIQIEIKRELWEMKLELMQMNQR
tara:strand:+ start:86 stop:229 length:144 start_codon:yes stop_codon:yes gene_type:complete